MTDSAITLRHQIGSAADLQSVVRAMRAMAASNIHHYERSVLALKDYRQAVNLGLGTCLRRIDAKAKPVPELLGRSATGAIGVIVFGSDHGLVGQFNEVIVEHATRAMRTMPGEPVVWAVGERALARLRDLGVAVAGVYPVPISVQAIAPLVDQIQFDTGTHASQAASPHIHMFYNRPLPGTLYEPVNQRLLPLDDAWRAEKIEQVWPDAALPEVVGRDAATLRSLIREHLFISLFRACAESLASENASRLAAMERADKNIEELLATLRSRLHVQRQSSIDEELFDVVAGYEALSVAGRMKRMSRPEPSDRRVVGHDPVPRRR